MNVYEKLQQLRMDLQRINPKKTGNNKFAWYTYYELGDFIPHVNQLMEQHKLTSCLSFGDMGILEIVNTENPEERVIFTAPMSTAALKGCHEVQNLGAVITYIRRYLWTNALELTEHDALDATTGSYDKKPPAQPTTPKPNENAAKGQETPNTGTETPAVISAAQASRLYAIASGKGKKKEVVIAEVKKNLGIEPEAMTKAQYNKIVAHYESLPDKEKEIHIDEYKENPLRD